MGGRLSVDASSGHHGDADSEASSDLLMSRGSHVRKAQPQQVHVVRPGQTTSDPRLAALRIHYGAPSGALPEDGAARAEGFESGIAKPGPPLMMERDAPGSSSSGAVTIGTVRAASLDAPPSAAAVGGSPAVLASPCTVAWSINVSDYLRRDSSQSPCGCNLKYYSPIFRLRCGRDYVSAGGRVVSGAVAGTSSPGATQKQLQAKTAAGGAGTSLATKQATAPVTPSTAGEPFRMFWALFDHDPTKISLYLERLSMTAEDGSNSTASSRKFPAAAGESGLLCAWMFGVSVPQADGGVAAAAAAAAPGGGASSFMQPPSGEVTPMNIDAGHVDISFSKGVVGGGAPGNTTGSLGVATAAADSAAAAAAAAAAVARRSGLLKHVFTAQQPGWGLQGLLGVADLDELAACADGGALEVRLDVQQLVRVPAADVAAAAAAAATVSEATSLEAGGAATSGIPGGAWQQDAGAPVLSGSSSGGIQQQQARPQGSIMAAMEAALSEQHNSNASAAASSANKPQSSAAAAGSSAAASAFFPRQTDAVAASSQQGSAPPFAPAVTQLLPSPGQLPTVASLLAAAVGQQAFSPQERAHLEALVSQACSTQPSVYVASLSPRVLLVENALSAEVCDALRALSEPRLIRSRVSTGLETNSRTSSGTFFTGEAARHPLVLAVETRLEQLMCSVPEVCAGKRRLEKTEALQVVKYGTGEFYAEHYDNRAGGVITRAATIIVYLDDTSEGGATYFPRSTGLPEDGAAVARRPPAALAALSQALHASRTALRPGLKVLPAKGRAVVFWSRLPDGSEDLASLHSAEPVARGTKWIATRWFKEAD